MAFGDREPGNANQDTVMTINRLIWLFCYTVQKHGREVAR